MKNLLVILDPAHGEEISGKRSPDGRHREYKWSRERLRVIEHLLQVHGYTVVWTNTTDREIGLTKRQNIGTQLAKQHPGLVPLFISLHNDASGVTPEWRQANGVSVWTSKGRTTSDIFADFFIQRISEWMSTVNRRIYSPAYLDRDFESDFTVLMGDYPALLIECGFQDNKEDVARLEDPRFCKQVEDWIVDSIEDCNNYVSRKVKK
ncbi:MULTISPECIES: N-acetylmuramoyl-L-alanine amidase [unclassified Dysgonomonas]|uniref:N-acetylmuramoyl-L-alanine amidase n=1 Tax=unclassified Dysgonomonas TaxID=2630389 RepID=UPI0025BC3C8F|nr:MULTISPECIES: N-acetylmuramoyl-L-alanine amidase [unclassified Dysgonomonas]HMM02052.1 N-acetylmuramoyl-L-alanine amidase [Dysgonomonas sp.]